MDNRMDQKTRDKILNAIEGAKAYHRQLEMKREQRIWKKIEIPCNLFNMLSLLTKNELDIIRKKLELKGISSLNKGELARELERFIPVHFQKVLYLLDQERYELIQGIIKNFAAMPISNEFPISKIEALMGFGIIFPVIHNGQKLLTMPMELIELFAKIDVTELQDIINRNTEWIRLTHGLLYYYGVLDTSKMLDKISTLTKQKVDTLEYFNVFSAASDYYGQARFSSFGLADHRIFDAKKIIEEHKKRPDVDYYPFTKKQLLKAGDSAFIDKTPAMEKFLQFLLEFYDLTDQETDEIALQLINMINMDANPSMLIQYLQSQLEIPSFEFLQLLTEKLVEVYNNTRMWVLKGYTPNELYKKEEKQLNPLPSLPTRQTRTGSSVIDISSRTKTGRNDPCPCGSGKKYKKCCGKNK